MPCGRCGAGGTAPARIASVQSANIFSTRGRPKLASAAFICAPACPDCTRRSHAATVFGNGPSAAGTSRVAFVPSAWHAVQPPDLMLRIQSPWLFMFGLMPLPLTPVPGNSCAAGTSISDSQCAAG